MSSETLIRKPPTWLEPYRASSTDRLLYDGDCGLCHRAVTFVLEQDASESAFVFTPLRSERARAALPDPKLHTMLPDSIVVVTERGEVLTKSSAALYIGLRLGGLWRGLATLGRLVPRDLRDLAYDLIAAVRHRVFAKPQDVCPMLPPEMRSRFEM